MSGKGTETRQLTEGVFVRFTADQMERLRGEAQTRGVSLPPFLLRERSLGIERAAS